MTAHCSSRWRRPAALLLLPTLLLAGCALGPDLKTPQVAEPGAWREAGGAQPAAWPSTDWWRGFRSSQLDKLIGDAELYNYDLGAAVARVREADAEARVAGAALLPSVGATAGASKQQEVFPINGGQTITFPEYNLGLTASYEIDFWGKNHAALAAAKSTALASRYDQQVVALTVVSSVANTYFLLLAFEDRLNVARQNLSTAESVLGVIEGQRRIGTAMDLDVSQQRTVVANLRALIPPLEQQISQTRDALAVLVGQTPEQISVAPGTLDELAQPRVAPGLPSELLARRPDIAEAEAQLTAANANIKVARAQFYPSFQITASGGFASVALGSFLSGAGAVYSLAGSITQPIFEGGALKGQLEFSKARYAELVQDYRGAVLSAFRDVEDALAAVQRTAEQEAAQETTVAEAQRSLDIAQARYRIGLTDLLTVLNTENALFPAEDTLLQIKLAHIQALVSLFKALGGGWETPAPPATAAVNAQKAATSENSTSSAATPAGASDEAPK